MDSPFVKCDLRYLAAMLFCALRRGYYQVIFADCPWHYNNRRLVRHDGGTTRFGIGAVGRYRVMTTYDIGAIPIWLLAGPQCHLYLWATMPRLPAALYVGRQWGFEYVTIAHTWEKICTGAPKTVAKWMRPYVEDGVVPTIGETCATLDKVSFFGTGYYSAANQEALLLFRKGRPFKHAKGRKARQVLHRPLSKHSRKPEDFQTAVEWMYPQCTRRLELFGRRARTGWDVMGNECVFEPYTSPYIASPEDYQWT